MHIWPKLTTLVLMCDLWSLFHYNIAIPHIFRFLFKKRDDHSFSQEWRSTSHPKDSAETLSDKTFAIQLNTLQVKNYSRTICWIMEF